MRWCAAALLGLAGCLSQQPRLQSDDDAEREKDLKLQLIVHDVATGKKVLGPFTVDGQILAPAYTTEGSWLVATSKVTKVRIITPID